MRWADYATGRPSAAALKAAGFGGVIRYIGLGGGAMLPYKRITAAEYQDHVRNGLKVLLVCEASTTDAWGGYNAGVANAKAALADARALGIPDSVGIAAAADSHAANQSQIDAAVQYARGFQDVLGKERTGFYGFSETVSAVRAAGIGSWYWRCGSQPTTTERGWTNLWQRNDGTVLVAGTTVDINEQYIPITASPEDDLTPDQANRLIWLEQAVRTLVNQVTGDPKGDPSFDANMNWQDGHVPGWPSMVDSTKAFSLVDYIRLIDLHTCQDNDIDKQVLSVVQALSPVTGNIDVNALAAALSTALGPEVAKAIGEKLVA